MSVDNQHVKNKLDNLSKQLFLLNEECCSLSKIVKLEMDKKALDEISTNLSWACENLTVIGLHQIDEALEDNMGTGISPSSF